MNNDPVGRRARRNAHLVALIATVGAFSMTCLTAATFQIDPPADNPIRPSSCSRPKRLAVSKLLKNVAPVIFPPGRLRLATSPDVGRFGHVSIKGWSSRYTH
jgi:hypothetical protein